MHAENAPIYPDCPAVTRTVEVGGRTKAELRDEFRRHGISMNAMGERLFADADFTETGPAYRVETVELQVQQLGLTAGGTAAEVFAQAAALGLELCPLEVAPYLRLQYLHQPEGPLATVASPKPSKQPDYPSGFYLRRREDGLWLRGYTASEDWEFAAEERFVFCRQRGVPPAAG